MSLSSFIKGNPGIKKTVHYMLIPKGKARPRRWVNIFVNPFFHKKGKGAVVHAKTRMDVLPFNKFLMGNNAVIEDYCTVNNGVGDVIIGDNSAIGIGCVLIGPVTIGNYVVFAQNIVASGLNHEYRDVSVPIRLQNVTTKTITIEDDCWIAANSVITAGVTIGRHCVIAAGAVVTKDIPPYSIAAGNPARVIKQYNHELKEWVKV